VEPENVDAFCNAIASCLDDEEARVRMGQNARERALKVWQKSQILAALETEMQRVVVSDVQKDEEGTVKQV
jgi:glycosyltransferase involved in cell wall biosynthesis